MTASERRIVLAAIVALGFTGARVASADESPKIVAEELFTTGRALLDAGQVDAACPKLAESQRLDPAGGTALLLGMCLERQGKLASAWAALHSARAMADRDGRQDRIAVAEEHLHAVEPRLSRVMIHVPPDSDVPALHVYLDGVELGAASRDTMLPVDAGAHELRATASGYPPFSITVTIPAEGGTTHAVVGPLVPLGRSAPEQPGSRMVPLLATAALGVIAVGVTTYYGVNAIKDENDKPATCLSTNPTCQDERSALEQRRNSDATVATVAGTVSVAAAAAAVVLLVLPRPAAKRDQAGWSVSPFGLAGAALSGRF
jgi:hypothetical protein